MTDETRIKKPAVSVIMNCFNSDTFLRETLDSLFAQRFSDFEVIFWDNQSTDRSAEIVNSYGDPRVKYIYAPRHTTLGEARNLAMMEAKADWIAFLDCDDIWHPEKLTRQMDLVRSSEKSLGLVYTKTVYLGGPHNGKELNPEYQDKPSPEGNILAEYLAVGNFVPLPAALIRKSAYLEAGKIPNHLKQAEDYYLFAAIAANYSTRCVQQVLTFYRVHGSNLSHKQRFESVAESLIIIREFLPKAKLSRKTWISLINRQARYSFLAVYYGILDGHSLIKILQSVSLGGILLLPMGSALEIHSKILRILKTQGVGG
jgi:glycosyltransferase involved in cell wall biosynthesis